MRTIFAILTVLAVVAALAPAAPAQGAGLDYAIPGGHFYTQGSGIAGSSAGFSVADDAVAPYWSWYQALGGPEALGYPISRRFMWRGMVTQATERALLQWNGATGEMQLANVVDALHEEGWDEFLQARYGVPPLIDDGADHGLTWSQIVARHLALLNGDPVLRDRYFADSDPLSHYGLPMAVQDTGAVFVVRAQRAVLKHWKMDSPSTPGLVTVLHAGLLAREAQIVPEEALLPEPASPELAAMDPLSGDVSSELVEAIREARPAVVKITVVGSSPAPGHGALIESGTGVIFDPAGYIVTNNHVIDNPGSRMTVRLPDGRAFEGRLVAADANADVAVVKIDGARLPAISFGRSQDVEVGEPVAAIGYSPFVPGDPSVGIGEITGLGQQIREPNGTQLHQLLQTDAGLFPGYSGGPLVNEDGDVVGINTAVRTRLGRIDPERGLAIPADIVQPLVRNLMRQGRSARLAPETAPFGLPVPGFNRPLDGRVVQMGVRPAPYSESPKD